MNCVPHIFKCWNDSSSLQCLKMLLYLELVRSPTKLVPTLHSLAREKKQTHPKLFLPKSVFSEFKSPFILHHFILCPPCLALLASSKWKGNLLSNYAYFCLIMLS